MGIREDYKPFMDGWGLVHSEPRIDQNGPRFTAEYYYALKRAGVLDGKDKIEIEAAYAYCELQPGLLRRHPSSIEGEGPDDHYGALAVSKELGGDFARRWLRYGRAAPIFGYDDTYDRKKWYSKLLMWGCELTRYKFIFNCNRPGYFNESAWMGRQLPMVAHAQICAGEKLSLFWQLAWCAGVILSAKNKSSQDGKVLTWFAIKASEGSRSWVMSLATKYWSKKLREQWPGGIGGVLGAYFTNKDQPSIKWLWDEYAD